MSNNFQSQNRNNRKKRARSSRRVVYFSLGLVLLLSLAALVRMPLGAGIWMVLVPTERMTASAGMAGRGLFAQFSSKAALAAENAALKEQLAEAQARTADRDMLFEENLTLKSQFNRADAKPDTTLAAVVARPPALPYDTVMIDAGADHSIVAGQLVSAGEGTGALIGSVAEVYPASARVVLFSSAGVQHQGMLHGTVPVKVTGLGSGALEAEVPAGTDVKVGDTVTFPSIAPGVSEVISSIDAPQGDSFKMLHMHLPANMAELRFVEVWKQSISAQQ